MSLSSFIGVHPTCRYTYKNSGSNDASQLELYLSLESSEVAHQYSHFSAGESAAETYDMSKTTSMSPLCLLRLIVDETVALKYFPHLKSLAQFLASAVKKVELGEIHLS